MSYLEQNQRIVAQYRQVGQPWPAQSVEIARWAVSNKLWEIHPSKIIRQCADQIADAMRQEYIRDDQGRRVRAKHAATYSKEGRQFLLWDDMRTATHTHMELSFQNRRQQAVMDCKQLKMDVDSYNHNYNAGAPIQMVLDFRLDVEEMELINRHAAA